MALTLTDLLQREEFHLRLLVEPVDPAALDVPIVWAHSSDLPDPTPWLESGQLLLTDGMHFVEPLDPAFAAAYVQRLVGRGVLALGFATDILHAHVPPAVVDACRSIGLPLIEVADRTPFMAIIRAIADERESARLARLEWSLEAHRAVARAALRPQGLEAILAELESRLRTWVVLVERDGRITHASPRTPLPEALIDEVTAAVRDTVARGSRASFRLQAPDRGFTVQTIGRRGALHGALAVGSAAPLDPAENELVTSVIALASIALEQTSALQGVRAGLGSAVLELLLAGQLETARATAVRLGLAIPEEETIRVVATRSTGRRDEGDGVLASFGGFTADRDDLRVTVVPASTGTAAATALAERGHAAVVSAAVPWIALPTALQQVQQLLVDEVPAGTARSFDESVARGLFGVLRQHEGALVAAALLAPARRSEDGLRLLESARVWLQHNGSFDPAARELGIHRHTLRTRMESLGGLVGLDLDRFSDRAELWSALRLAGLSSGGSPG